VALIQEGWKPTLRDRAAKVNDGYTLDIWATQPAGYASPLMLRRQFQLGKSDVATPVEYCVLVIPYIPFLGVGVLAARPLVSRAIYPQV
jgi:hypothetical protein